MFIGYLLCVIIVLGIGMINVCYYVWFWVFYLFIKRMLVIVLGMGMYFFIEMCMISRRGVVECYEGVREGRV